MSGALIGYVTILGLLDRKDEEITIFGNVTNYLPSETAQNPGKNLIF
jgi:hypothetical protein